MIVADTNLVAYLVIEGQYTALAGSVLAKDPDWVAPGSWRYELMNVLATYCRQKLMTVERALDSFTRATALVSDVPFDPEPARVLSLSVQSGCSGYDCVFVAAAQMNGLRLVTFDRRVLTAFPGLAVTAETFVSEGDAR